MSLLKNPTVGLAVVNPVAENQIVVGNRAAARKPPSCCEPPAAQSLPPEVSLTAAENLLVAETLPAAVGLAVVGNLLAVESLAAAANLTTQSSTAGSLTVANPTVESLVAICYYNVVEILNPYR
jgi:hypothetical protein